MSDSGFSQFPTKPPPAAGASVLNPRGEIKAQIIEISGKIARLENPQTVTGEVTKVNRDGTVQIRTAQGDLTIKPRERITPAEGQKLQVDLPAGAPPRQVTVRPAPPVPAPSTPAPNTPATGTAVPRAPVDNTVTNPSPARPPLDPQVQAHLNLQQATRQTPATTVTPQALLPPAPVPSPQPLPPDALLRLTLLPLAQIKDTLTQMILPPPPMPMRVTAQHPLQTDTLAQNLSPPAIKNLFSTSKSNLSSLIKQQNEGSHTASSADMPMRPLLFTGMPATPGKAPPVRFVPPLLALITTPEGSQPPTLWFNRMSLQPPRLMTGTSSPHPLLSISLLSIPKNASLITPPLSDLSVPVPHRTLQTLDVRVQTVQPPPLSLIAPPPAAGGVNTSPTLTLTSPAPSLLQPGLITQPQAAAQMTGHVVGLTARHTPVIMVPLPQTGEAAFFTTSVSASNLIPGTGLIMTPQPGGITLAAPAIPATPPSVFELMSGFRWPVFDELAETQNLQIQTATAQSLAQILPSPAQPARLPAAALLFIAAVRAGDLQAWLGEKTIDGLRRSGKADWVARMTREFSGLSKLVAESVSADWRGISIPLYSQGQVEKIHLYYRSSEHNQEQDQGQENKGASTRFIFDLNLSVIGPLQLDGYVRGKVLDLAVRTAQPFSAAMRHDMTQRYIHTLEAAGLEGALIFQSHPDKWVHITPRADLLRTSI